MLIVITIPACIVTEVSYYPNVTRSSAIDCAHASDLRFPDCLSASGCAVGLYLRLAAFLVVLRTFRSLVPILTARWHLNPIFLSLRAVVCQVALATDEAAPSALS